MFRQCRFDHAGVDGAVLQRGRVVVEFDDLRKAPADIVQGRPDDGLSFIFEVVHHPAGRDHVAHQSMTECAVGGAQHALTQDAAVRVHQRERGIVADGADVAEMVGEPLEFRQERTQPDGAIRHHKFQCRLCGLRKCVGIGDGAVA